MEITIRYICSSIIELTVTDHGVILTSTITNLDGTVDTDFITNLRNIADELEEHNTGNF